MEPIIDTQPVSEVVTSEGPIEQMIELNYDARQVARQLEENLPVTSTAEKPKHSGVAPSVLPAGYVEIRSGVLTGVDGRELPVSRQEEGLSYKPGDREVLGVLISFPDIDNPQNTIEIDLNGRLRIIPNNDFSRRITLELNQSDEKGRQSIHVEFPSGNSEPLDKILNTARKGLDFLKTVTVKPASGQIPPASSAGIPAPAPTV